MTNRASSLALLCLAALACTDTTVTGMGRAEAVIQDTPGTSPATGSSLAGNSSAAVSADGVTWVNLGSPNGITVALQEAGTTTTVHGETGAPAGDYSRVRLVFSGVEARLLAGAVIGGVTLTSNVDLTLGGADQEVVLTVSVPEFTIEDDPAVRRTIVFDLRSHLWLTSQALQAGTVEDAAIQGAIQASTRLENR